MDGFFIVWDDTGEGLRPCSLLKPPPEKGRFGECEKNFILIKKRHSEEET